jgi:PAS domain S-box-containing protein
MASTRNDLRALIVAPLGRDGIAMAAALEENQIAADALADLSQCSREVTLGAGCLLLTEEGLGTAGATELVEALEAQPSWSDLPMVVLTTGDAAQRLELLHRLGLALGVVTLLERPLRHASLVSAVQVALKARRRQYQVRDLLAEREQREWMLRERAEALRMTEARTREMADTAPAMLWVSAPGKGCIYVSRSWYDYTGLPEGSGLSEGWQQGLHPDDRERVVRAFAEAAERREPVQQEYRLRVADGTYRWVLDVARPRVEPDGALAGYIGSLVDIQELRLAERESERHRALLDAVLDSLPVGVVIGDPQGRLIRWNAAQEDLWGLDNAPPPDAVPFQHLIGWWPDTGARILPHEWTLPRALVERKPVPAQLVEIERFDGRGRRFLMAASAPVFDAAGEVVAAVSAQTDVTDRVQLEQALREADRRKDQFLATLAHELRNPLAPVRMAVDMLKAQNPDAATLVMCRDILDRQVSDLTRLVDDLLEVSRITRGKLDLRKGPVTLQQIVDRAIEAASPLINASQHTLVVSMPPRETWLDADATRLAQVFTNLLNNAARYTGSGGRIELSAEALHGEVRVTVRDTGVGIAAEHLPGIFEMFSQVAPALERSGSGLGVGLALARGLVELHGGTVTAASAGVGQGSEFLVRLPEAEPPAEVAAARDGTIRSATRRSVLVVDDNRDSADGLAMLLEMLGHEVAVAYDGAEAVACAERLRPAVMLLDIGLPTLNGYQVAQQVRGKPWGKDMLLVAQTGWGQQEDKRRAQEAGFDHHLTKPVDIDAITRLLDRAAVVAN